jgi:uncharacterized protein DUF2510
MTTPPGWYPDPGHAGDGPAPERWWDGTEWSGYTRAAGEAMPGPAAPPPVPPPPPPPGPGTPERLPTTPGDPRLGAGRGNGALLAAIAGGSLVLAALVIGAVLLFGGDSGERHRADEEPTPTAPARQDPTTPTSPAPSSPAPLPLTEGHAGGVALPLLDGWEEGDLTGGAAVTTAAGYPCPADDGQECRTAGAFLAATAGPPGDTAEEVAAADIARNARESYNRNAYGRIVSDEEVLAEEITVAGRPGYRVRWRIETGAGTEAYVESVAFPAPAGPDGHGEMLLLRLGFDIADDAPPTRDIDRIIDGTRAVSGGPGTEA